MAKATKLKSGNWRVLVFSHTDLNGKRVYKSFTAPTKRQAEQLANEWKFANTEKETQSITFGEAIDKHIATLAVTGSPTTVMKYQSLKRNHLQSISRVMLDKVDNRLIQDTMDVCAVKLSPKTCKDVLGLITATMARFRPSYRVSADLPKVQKVQRVIPNNDDVKRHMEYVKGDPMEIAVLLAAFGPMRRGEICALDTADIDGCRVHVHRNMVQTKGECVIRQPKTVAGDRFIDYPRFVGDKLAEFDGRVFPYTPRGLDQRWTTICRKLGLSFRSHDLRHYSASIQHALGVPDAYIMARGGWSDDRTLKDVYRHSVDDVTEQMNVRINEYFSGI